jgi:putative sterol carrier protein
MSSGLAPSSGKLRFPSAEWCVAYKEAINASQGYKVAGREWTHGPVAMVVTADPSIGLPEDMALLLDVDQGTCRACTLMSRAEAEKASFVLVAPYSRWKEVIRKELDPTKGMMQNKLKLTKGHMPTMVKFVTSNKELVEATTRVPTQFIDE